MRNCITFLPRKFSIGRTAPHALPGEVTESVIRGHFCIDEQVLHEQGISDLSVYSDCPESDLIPDAFI